MAVAKPTISGAGGSATWIWSKVTLRGHEASQRFDRPSCHRIETGTAGIEIGNNRAAHTLKLAPVTAWFVRERPRLRVVQTDITV
jgi:hypothetical protein